MHLHAISRIDDPTKSDDQQCAEAHDASVQLIHSQGNWNRYASTVIQIMHQVVHQTHGVLVIIGLPCSSQHIRPPTTRVPTSILPSLDSFSPETDYIIVHNTLNQYVDQVSYRIGVDIVNNLSSVYGNRITFVDVNP